MATQDTTAPTTVPTTAVPSGTDSFLAPSDLPLTTSGEATPMPKKMFPPYPPYTTVPAPASVVDAIMAGRDIRVQQKSVVRKPAYPTPRPAKPKSPKATDVKVGKKAERAHARCLRRHGAVLTDRLERMSKPQRRTILYMWRERWDTLPPETIARFRAMLNADEPFKPDQAYEYFVNLRKTKKKMATQRGVKDVKRDLLAVCADKRFVWARNATVAFARGIQQRLKRPGSYALADGMLRLSDIVLEEICSYLNMKPPSRRTNNPKARFMMEMADKIAVWIDEIIADSDDRMLMMDFDEDAEVLASQQGSEFTDNFLDMMGGDGGGPGSGPGKKAHQKFPPEMQEAFKVLTNAMQKKGTEPLVSHGAYNKTYDEAATQLKNAPDFTATNFKPALANELKKKLSVITDPDTPAPLKPHMKELVNICSNYLAQVAEENKHKGKAFQLLTKAMRDVPNEKLLQKGTFKLTNAQAAKILDDAKNLDTDHDDPNLSQKIHSNLSKLVDGVTPDDIKKEMEGTLDLSSKYLSQNAVDQSERGPAFDLLVKELERQGGNDFTPEYPHLASNFAAGHALKTAPGLTVQNPDPQTAPRFNQALHAVVDKVTPPGLKEMAETIDLCANYLSAFNRDRDKALEILLKTMKSTPDKELVKRNDYSLKYDTAAAEIEQSPMLLSFLPVKDIADEIKEKLRTDVAGVTPQELEMSMKSTINDASNLLSQDVAVKSGVAGDGYALQLLSSVKKSLGERQLYKYKAYGQTYHDAGETLKNAGILEPHHPEAEGLRHDIRTEMGKGVSTVVSPGLSSGLHETMDDAAKHLAKVGHKKGEALDHLVGLMKDEGEVRLATLQETYGDAAKRIENAPTLTTETTEKAAYEAVKGNLTNLTEKKPAPEHDKVMPDVVDESSKFLAAPKPQGGAGTAGASQAAGGRAMTKEEEDSKMLALSEEERRKLAALPEDERRKLLALSDEERRKMLALSDEERRKMLALPEDERRKLLALPEKELYKMLALSDEERRKQVALLPEPAGVKTEEQRKLAGLSEEEQRKFLALSDEERRKLDALPEDERRRLLALSDEERSKMLALSDEERRKMLALPEDERRKLLALSEKELHKMLALSDEERQKQVALLPEPAGVKTEEQRKLAGLSEEEQRKLLGLSDEERRYILSLPESERKKMLALSEAERRKIMALPEAERKKMLALTEEEQRKQAAASGGEHGKQAAASGGEHGKQAPLTEGEQRNLTGMSEEERRKFEALPEEERKKFLADKAKRTRSGGVGLGGDAGETDPEHAAALNILHRELQAKGHETFHKQSQTELTHVQASDWLKESPPRLDKTVRDSGDTGRLSKKFEKKLGSLVSKPTPPQMQDAMEGVVIESSRRLSEMFVSKNYKTLACDALISEMQTRCNEILVEIGGAAETFFFAAQRLKLARSLDAREPCTDVAYHLTKKLDEMARCRRMARKLTSTMKEHIKEASNYLSEVVTKPDEKIEAYVALLGEMEAAGDTLLIQRDISKSFKDCAAYLRQLTSFQDRINKPDSSLQSETEGKLKNLMANVTAAGYSKSEMDSVIAESTRLLVSYIKLQGEKTETLKALIELMDQSGDALILRHGALRKNYSDAANLLRGKNTDQMGVQDVDPVVARKIQIKLTNLILVSAPDKTGGLMDDVINDATSFLAVNLLQPQVIKVCKCMKNVFVQCELWCEEILRRVGRPCCSCSRHASAQALADIASSLLISPGSSRAHAHGLDISFKACDKHRSRSRSREDGHPSTGSVCPAPHPTLGCQKSIASYYLYGTEYDRPHRVRSAITGLPRQTPSDSLQTPLSHSPLTQSPSPFSPNLSPVFNTRSEKLTKKYHGIREDSDAEASSTQSSRTELTSSSTTPLNEKKPFWEMPAKLTASSSGKHETTILENVEAQVVEPTEERQVEDLPVSVKSTYKSIAELLVPLDPTSQPIEDTFAVKPDLKPQSPLRDISPCSTSTLLNLNQGKPAITSRAPIVVKTDQMLDWHAMMVSLMWNMQAWREWIQENINRAFNYKEDDSYTNDEQWSQYERRVSTEALQWRQYNAFSRQLSQRLAHRYKDKQIVSPTRATVITETYKDCQKEMIKIIEMFNRWTHWLIVVVKETNVLTPPPGCETPTNELHWRNFKTKVLEHAEDWAKYDLYLKCGWEEKYKVILKEWFPAWEWSGPVWVVSTYGAVPSGAVAAGIFEGEVIWLARTTHGSEVLPAALHPSKHCCLLYTSGTTNYCTKYQVMCNASVNWVAWRAGEAGARAVRVAPGVHVGRVLYRGSHLVGAVRAPLHRCHVIIFDRQFAFNCYELLVLANGSNQPADQ